MQCAVVVILFSLIFTNSNISRKKILCTGAVYIGYLISDLILGESFNFYYEGLKPILLLIGLSVGEEDKKSLMSGMYVSAACSSALGILMYIFDVRSFGIVNFIDGEKILQGTFGYANAMAFFCGIGIVFSIYRISLRDEHTFLNEIILLMNCTAFILTKSIFGYVCLAAAFAIGLFIKYKKIRKYIICTVILVLVAVASLFFTGYERVILRPTVASRLIYWYDALRLFIANPLGIGVHNWENIQYAVQSADYSVKYVHNGYIQLLMDGGIISLLGFAVLIIFGYSRLIDKYKESRENLYIYEISALSFILLHSFVDIDFAYGIVWFVIGLLMSGSEKEKTLNHKKIIVFLIISALLSIIVPEYENTDYYSYEFKIACEKNDFKRMDEISEKWIKYAPRRQETFDARYYALKKLNNEDGISELREKKKQANETMNFLCKYLTQHKKIVLPGEEVSE